MITHIKKYGISVTLSVVILILCFMNTEPLPKVEMTNFDKLVHLVMFLALSGSVFFENSNRFRSAVSLKRMFWGSFLFPTLFSGLIELIQEYVSAYRTGDWMDFLFDGIGALAGFMICLILNRRLMRTKN